jgi:hypothetical protein
MELKDQSLWDWRLSARYISIVVKVVCRRFNVYGHGLYCFRSFVSDDLQCIIPEVLAIDSMILSSRPILKMCLFNTST